MGDKNYYIEIIHNKIWAYKIIFQKEPNALIIPKKIYEQVRCEVAAINKKVIISDDFKEIRCITIFND